MRNLNLGIWNYQRTAAQGIFRDSYDDEFYRTTLLISIGRCLHVCMVATVTVLLARYVCSIRRALRYPQLGRNRVLILQRTCWYAVAIAALGYFTTSIAIGLAIALPKLP